MKKVIVLGSLNMDLSIACERMPENGETLNGYGFFMNSGGKGGNQAVACARNGALTYMIANVGNDTFGQDLKEELRQSNVNVRYVIESPLPSGMAIIIRHDKDNRIILENGANHTIHDSLIKDAFKHIARYNDIFLTQLENNFSAVASALKQAHEKGMYTVFNPAPAMSLPIAIYQNVNLFVVNQSECEILSGIYPKDEETISKALHTFQRLGSDVIITLGKQGSVAYVEGVRYDVSAYHVEALDTTGAGDTFVGALCAKLASNALFEEALHYANAASALAVMKEGAQKAIPYQDKVDLFIKERSV